MRCLLRPDYQEFSPSKTVYIQTANFLLVIRMKCVKCGSLRMTKFVDGFGKRRIFCKTCYGSFLDSTVFENLPGQKNLLGLDVGVHYNPRAVIRHFG